MAQPGDETCPLPRIGPYDLHSIDCGYRPILDADSPMAEIPTLRQWILDMADGPSYRLRDGSRVDPTSLSEAPGDDAMRTSDRATRLHLENAIARIDEILDTEEE